jgi:ATP-dependent Clp protease ATP-binding subunit ClpA
MAVMILAEQQPVHGVRLSPRAEKVLRAAALLADEDGLDHVGTDHIARALLDEREGPHADLLRTSGRPRGAGRR